MPRGSKPGERRGGRRKGTLNKATVERRMRVASGLKAAVETGELPLDVILRRMRGDTTVSNPQFEAAVAAAPYCHPRLSAVAHQPAPDLSREERRAALAAIPYEIRRRIAALLEQAQASAGGAAIDGDAEPGP
jgi:hypothetical protein